MFYLKRDNKTLTKICIVVKWFNGPFFFENAVGEAVTVNGIRYR